ncbi:hypothetical protein [Actinospongicola halichondriae]|uniref:hypothetical protein n=1 Tax=Actinospongicola halichondriae TaxID=3236844 RepID=UPI003D375FA3
MLVHHLTSVDGEIVFDLDPDVAGAAVGRTYLREGVTAEHGAVLARAATYRAAIFEERVAGAAATIRPRLIDTEAETFDRLRDEVAPMAEAGRFALADERSSVARGIVAAMAAWFRGLEGRRIVVHGFDDLGAEVARLVVERGGHLAGVSTASGAIASGSGLDIDAVEATRADHGELFVTQLGLELHRTDEALDLAVDAAVLGGAVGTIDRETAERISAAVVVPSSDAPYAEAGLDVLRRRGIVALPDTVTTAGPTLEALAPRGLTDAEIAARADRLIGERIEGARSSKVDPYRYATTLADTFLTTWVPADHLPDGPAVLPTPSMP